MVFHNGMVGNFLENIIDLMATIIRSIYDGRRPDVSIFCCENF